MRGQWLLVWMARWPRLSAVALTAITVALAVGAGIMARDTLAARRHVQSLERCSSCINVTQTNVIDAWSSSSRSGTEQYVKIGEDGRAQTVELAWGNDPHMSAGERIWAVSDFGKVIGIAPLSASPFYATVDHPIYQQESDEMFALVFAGFAVMFGMLAGYGWAQRRPSADEPVPLLVLRTAVIAFWMSAIVSAGLWLFTGLPPGRDVLIGTTLGLAWGGLCGWAFQRRRQRGPTQTIGITENAPETASHHWPPRSLAEQSDPGESAM